MEDTNGNAILPVNFLPGIIQNLPDKWFYDTYKYYPYFDPNQRDVNGNISIPIALKTAMPANVNKWKECAKLLGDQTFKETGKLEYGYEICRMIDADGYNLGPCSSAIAMRYLFKTVAPELMKKNHITELIALVFKWMYVPTLESNNQWLLQGMVNYFKNKGAKVVLSTNVLGHKRQHSVMQYFKKYATQSHLGNFRKKQRKEWNFLVEVSCSRDKSGSLPYCKTSERWTDHDISSYLAEKFKMMMCRNGKYNLLVRHFDSNVSVENVFENELGQAVQRAMRNGCSIDKLMRSLDAEKESLKGMLCPDVVGVSIDGLRGDQVYNDNLTGNLLLDQLSGLGVMDDIFGNESESLLPYDERLTSTAIPTPAPSKVSDKTPPPSAVPTPPPSAVPPPTPAPATVTPPGLGTPSHTTPARAVPPSTPPEYVHDQTPPPAPSKGTDQTPSAPAVPPPSPPASIPHLTSPLPAPAPEKATAPPAKPGRTAPPPGPVRVSAKLAPPVNPQLSKHDRTTPPTGVPDIPIVPKMAHATTQGNRNSVRRNHLTERQREACHHITRMQECSRDAIFRLEQMESSPVDMYADYGRKYLKEYIGMYRCHLRALWNVNTRAAAEAFTLNITNVETEAVFAILKKYEDGSNGQIFHLREYHWVALQKVPESDAGLYYDDKILMAVGNYDAAAETLRLVEKLSVAEYSRVFQKKGNNSFSSKMKQLNTKNNGSKPVKRKAKEYGSRNGMSLVPQYGRGTGKKKFGVWHCKDAFKAKKECVDGVCVECKILYNKNGHKCPICKESIVDYHEEANAKYMPRKRPKWSGPGPEKCSICEIEL